MGCRGREESSAGAERRSTNEVELVIHDVRDRLELLDFSAEQAGQAYVLFSLPVISPLRSHAFPATRLALYSGSVAYR
jgi:hypothetical protein